MLLLAAVVAACAAEPAARPALEAPVRPKAPPPSAKAPELPAELEPRSRALVDALSRHEFERVVQELDQKLGAALDATKLELAWRQATAALGKLEAVSIAKPARVEGQDVVIASCQFERGAIDVKLVYGKQKKLAGLWLAPAWSPPSYAAPDRFSERELVIGKPPWQLPATLTLPKASEPVPAVVLVHGSGPQDRDETIGPNKPFKDLAWGLASRKIAVLRYDKRTRVHLERIRSENVRFTIDDETVNDALGAAALLRETEGIDPARVFVLGHSLGGSMLPRIGARDEKLAGLIGLAASSIPLQDKILAQFRYLFGLDGTIDDAEKQKLAALEEQAKQVRALKPADADGGSVVFGAPASYWLDLRGYDAAKAAKALRQRMLFLQGDRDYQVTLEDFQRFERALAGKKNVKLKTYLGLNHLFVHGDGKSRPEEYELPGHVHETVIDDVAAFIAEAR